MPQKMYTLLGPQSRFGDKPVKFQVVCPQNGTAVSKGLTEQQLPNPIILQQWETVRHHLSRPKYKHRLHINMKTRRPLHKRPEGYNTFILYRTAVNVYICFYDPYRAKTVVPFWGDKPLRVLGSLSPTKKTGLRSRNGFNGYIYTLVAHTGRKNALGRVAIEQTSSTKNFMFLVGVY